MIITHLPDELLRLIIRHLASVDDRLSFVSTCRTWHHIGAVAVYGYNDGEPITWALRNGCFNMTERALAAGAPLFGLHHLTLVAATGRVELAKRLLQSETMLAMWRACSRDKNEMTPLVAAAACGNVDMMQLLLDVPDVDVADSDGDGWDALSIACFYRNYDAVRLLLDRGFDPAEPAGQRQVHPPLQWAADQADVEIMKLLLSHLEEYFEEPHLKEEHMRIALPCAVDLGQLSGSIWDNPTTTLQMLRSVGLGKVATGSSDKAVECVELLLAQGAFESEAQSFTLLHLALLAGHTPIAWTLIYHGWDIHVVCNTLLGPRTPLLFAVALSDVRLVQYLLDHGAVTEITSGRTWGYYRAIDIAAKAGQPEMVKLLLEHDPSCDINKAMLFGHTPLYLAAGSGSRETCKVLVDHGASFQCQNSDGYGVLHEAKTPEVAKFLLQAGVPVDVENMQKSSPEDSVGPVNQACRLTPLERACRDGRGSVAQVLLDAGADPMVLGLQGHTTLLEAARNGLCDIVASLVERGLSVDQAADNGDTPLLAAVSSRQLPAVEQLLKLGADVTVTDYYRQNAVVVGRGSVDTVKMLVKYGADINSQMPGGGSILHIVVRSQAMAENRRAFYDLVNLGADLESRDDRGYSVLHAAVMSSAQPKAKYWVIEAGGDVNTVNDKGCTPLISASRHGDLDAVDVLVQNGAKLEATVGERTALHVAARRGHDKVVQALLEYGADPNTANVWGTDRCKEIVRRWIEKKS